MPPYLKHECQFPALAMPLTAGCTRENRLNSQPALSQLTCARRLKLTGTARQDVVASSNPQNVKSFSGNSTQAGCRSLRSPSSESSVALLNPAEYSFCKANVNLSGPNQQAQPNPGATTPKELQTPSCDSSGYAVFSEGDIGAMHVLAHRLLDSGENEQGYHLLGRWLTGRSEQGSQWVHIQWHMAIFELSLGYWQAALNRFWKYILPAVLTSNDALTDAPALLWRLALDTTKQVCLPWDSVRDRALLSLHGPCSGYVKLHNLLALAGARDIKNLDAWIRHHATDANSQNEGLVIRFAGALRSFAAGDFSNAASDLSTLAPKVARLGGSRAQNEIFFKMRDAARRRAVINTDTPPLLHAA